MSPDVSHPDGLSGTQQTDPAMLAALQEGAQLKDKDVFDVNGQKLGKVSAAFAEAGALTRLDVTLTANAKQLFRAEQDVAGVAAVSVARVDEDGVRLSEAAEQILHPEDPRPANASPDQRGAQELPRKNR